MCLFLDVLRVYHGVTQPSNRKCPGGRHEDLKVYFQVLFVVTCGFLISFYCISGPSTPCKEDSCKDGSLCVNLLNDYFCLCSQGYYYNSSTCNRGELQRMNNGNVHLRPKGNRKLKIMMKRASGILKGEENVEATKASQAEKEFVFISVEPSGRGNGSIQICELVLEAREGMGPFTLSG